MLAELFEASYHCMLSRFGTSWILTDSFQVFRQHQRQERRYAVEWLRKDLPIFTDIAEPAKGTCEWLMNNPQYQDWQKSGFRQPVWLQGKPGMTESF